MTLSALPQLPAERRLEIPLLRYLAATGRIRPDTLIVHEFPWNGRRVDIVTRTMTGIISSFELKIGNVSRAIEQAAYNTVSFDKSWIVVDREISTRNSQWCADLGIGVIVVAGNRVRIQASARRLQIDPPLKRRLALKLTHRRFG
jgi:hypothetical protein